MLRSRLLLTSLLLAAAVVAPVAQAQAADTVLAPAPDTAGLTAYGGHVVLSRRDPQTGMWALVRWHAGGAGVLPVAPRAVPFDADAGPDAQGDPVVVYSRCREDPVLQTGSLAPAADWQTARGCDVYELALTGSAPRERRLTVASSTSRSETTPSTWRGALAFARHADGGQVPQVLYLDRGRTAPRRLGAGSVPACSRPSRCSFTNTHESVDQLDLGPSRAAYVWRMTGGAVYGTGIAWELRAAPLAGGRSTLLDTGLISGTCGFALPSAPTASTSPISYLDARADCDATATSFATADPVSGARATAATPGGLAAAAARDGDTIYWLRVSGRDPRTPVPGAGACGVATARCELVASSVPQYAPQPARRQSPPADIAVARSDLGYRWVRGPAGTRLLRPPARVPCAPSQQSSLVYASARWSRGSHTVRVLRRDPGTVARRVGSPLTRSTPAGSPLFSLLRRCGDRTRLTYVVTSGRATQRVSFAVARASLPR